MINYDISRIKRNLNKWTSTTKRIVLVQFFSPFRNNCKSQAEKNMQMFSPNNQKNFVKK